MTTAGWLFLVVFWGAIAGLTAWCFSKLLGKP